jgi:hypothetical protein
MGNQLPEWDTGKWRNCFHFRPAGHPEPNVETKMDGIAKKFRRFDVKWGVVNPGNALCAGVFRTKRLATEYKRQFASAYVVVKVVVTPLYMNKELDKEPRTPLYRHRA